MLAQRRGESTATTGLGAAPLHLFIRCIKFFLRSFFNSFQWMKMSCLVLLFCDLLEVCAVFIRAVFHRFRDLYSTHQERLSGKTTKSSFADSVTTIWGKSSFVALSCILEECTLILPRVVRTSNQQHKIDQSGRSLQVWYIRKRE